MARKKQTKQSTGSLFSHVTPAHIMGPRLILLLSVLALLLLGLVMVYSASSIEAIANDLSPSSYVIRQLPHALVGIAGGLILWRLIPYHWWSGKPLWIVWGLAVILLILTAVFGAVGLGAQRWLILGSVRIQGSEFAKIVFVLMSARIMFDLRNQEITVIQALTQGFIFVLLPLIFLYGTQSDLGTTLICLVGILVVMWIGEVPLRTMALVIGAGILFALAASLVGYRQDRFSFLNPWEDYYGTGFQLIHSFYAFAEGGLWGVGLGNSREKFLYLPEAETDFIFAIIGEELGLIGAIAVVILFLLFLYAGMRIVRSAPDSFGAMIAGGCTIMIIFQAFLNIGCVLGLLPTTGKPLPFLSYGGSSLVACLFMVGIILSVSEASDKPSIYEQRRKNLRVMRADNKQGNTRGTSSGSTNTRDTNTKGARNTNTQSTKNRSSSAQGINTRSKNNRNTSSGQKRR